MIDFTIKINYMDIIGQNVIKEFFDSTYINESVIQNISSFKLLKKIVENFSKTCNNINYYIFSIIVNEFKFEIISSTLDRILKIEGFRSFGSGGGDAFPVSIGIIDMHKNIRVEFMDGKFICRDN